MSLKAMTIEFLDKNPKKTFTCNELKKKLSGPYKRKTGKTVNTGALGTVWNNLEEKYQKRIKFETIDVA